MSSAKGQRPIPKLGLGLVSLNTSPPCDFTWTASHRRAFVDARRAEALGLESVFLSEHHFVADGYCPSLMVLAGSLLAATETLNIGTAALLLPLADGERLARQARSLGSLVERLRLGIALGYRREEFMGLNVERRRRGKLMDAMLEELLKVLEPEQVIICTASEPGLDRALRFDVPMLIDSAVPMTRALEWGDEFRAQSAHELTLIRECWVSDDGSAPPEAVAPHDFAFWQYIGWEYTPTWEKEGEGDIDPLLDPESERLQQATSAEEKWFRQTPEDFADFLAAIHARGFDRMVARIAWSGVPLDHSVMGHLAAISEQGVAA